MADNEQVQEISLDNIFLDRDTQIRAAVSEVTIQRYYDIMEDEAGRDKFPPILLFRDSDDRLWLADGHHRVMSAIRRKFKTILAIIRPGSKADAIWEAAQANSRNGLQLDRADIRRAVIMLLEAFPSKSTTSIAEVVGCAQSYVVKIKNQVITSDNLPEAEPAKVIGKDGKMYKARKNTKPKSDPPKREPMSDMPSQASAIETNSESKPSPVTSTGNEEIVSSAKHVDESFEYESPYTELPRNKDGVEVVPPLPSTTSPMSRFVPPSSKNWPHENEDSIIIGEGEKEKTEPLYYGGFRPTPQIPCPGGYGSRPIGQTTLKHIPREHPNRLTVNLLTWFPPGYVVEMVLDAMQQLQNWKGYGPRVTDWIMRQLNKKYGAHSRENEVADESADADSDNKNTSCESSGERLNECTPSEYVRNLTASSPEWFTQAVLGNLLTLEQEKRINEVINEPNGSKRRIADPIISELFHSLDHRDRMATFAGMFDTLLLEGREDFPKLMDDMTQKIQRQAAKSKSKSQEN